MQRDARRQLCVTVVELHAPVVDAPHHANYVLRLERAAEALVAHVAPGGIAHLELLQVEAGARKQLEVADVVVVQVRDDHVLQAGGVDVQQAQPFGGAAQVIAAALQRHRLGKPGVHQQLAARAAHQPYEIVERHRAVVRIAADEVLGSPPRVARVLDRVYLVERRAHVMVTRTNLRLPTCMVTVAPFGMSSIRSDTGAQSSLTPPCSTSRADSELLWLRPASVIAWVTGMPAELGACSVFDAMSSGSAPWRCLCSKRFSACRAAASSWKRATISLANSTLMSRGLRPAATSSRHFWIADAGWNDSSSM